MRKIVFLMILGVILFVIFFSYLISLTPIHPLGWQLLPLAIFGVGGFWAFSEALCTFLDLYLKPFLKKRFPKWA